MENSNYDYSYFDIDTHKGIGEIELYERYDEFLDENYGMIKIAGVAYDTSNAQKKVDPVAYEQGYYGWIDDELNETILDKDGLKEAIQSTTKDRWSKAPSKQTTEKNNTQETKRTNRFKR